jgi:hypothetical protein
VRAAISRTEWASSGGEGKKPTTAINPSGIVRKRLEREEERILLDDVARRHLLLSGAGTKREMMNSLALAALCDVNFDECFPALLI